jgi:hypothetical protein
MLFIVTGAPFHKFQTDFFGLLHTGEQIFVSAAVNDDENAIHKRFATSSILLTGVNPS